MRQEKRLAPQAIVELLFDFAYLAFALCVGVYFLSVAQGRANVALCGVLALTLSGGDAFHLLPRMFGLYQGNLQENYRALGVGKLITSITMTVFYVLLCYLWVGLYQQAVPVVMIAAWCLAAVRVALCLLPQNGWLTPQPSTRWAVVRNAPFLLLGLLVLGLYASSSLALGAQAGGFRFLWVAILLSFACYLPVVLFAQKHPAVGALMLPKTCAYVWMLCMGFSLLS